MQDDFTKDSEKLALFVTEYLRNEGKPEAGILAVTAASLRDPRYLPATIAEYLLSEPSVQVAIKAARPLFKPTALKKVSAETISQDMEALYTRCVEDRQYNAAIACKKLQAEANGLLDKTINLNVKHSVTTMTDAQLESIVRAEPIDAEYRDVSDHDNVPAVAR